MKRIVAMTLLALAFCFSQASAHPHLLRMADGSEVGYSEMIEDLKTSRLIFFGELHNHPGHHSAQLAVIRSLVEAGLKPAIGLEMFRSESQKDLDLWVSGRTEEPEFIPAFNSNWKGWSDYRGIFDFAREGGLPMVGLNLSRRIIGKVAREGFASLTAEEVKELGGITCDPDPPYRNYLKQVMGGHFKGNGSFTFFCEAQLLWDKHMASRILEFLGKNPEATVVVLSGGGHAWKHGIPAQVSREMEISYKVIMPELPDRLTRHNATEAETDYLWLAVDEDGWQAPE